MSNIPGDENRTGSRKGGSHIVDPKGNEIKTRPVEKPTRKRSTRHEEKEEEGGEE